MTTDLYAISDYQASAAELSCEISYNKQHTIFEGHFPGNPIVPGVCTMQMIGDLLAYTVQKKLRLTNAANIKYLQLITPDIRPTVGVTWSVYDHTYTANAILKDGARTLFKMSAVYAVSE